MKDFEDWSPLNDVWEKHGEYIEKTSQTFFLKDGKEDFSTLIWPEDLYIGEQELEDVEDFIHQRTHEMVDIIKNVRGVPPDMLSSFLLRTLISGMEWQNERTGK